MEHNFVGFANEVRQRILVGWAFDALCPNLPLVVQININGATAGFSLANQYREDLRLAAIGDGCHGFEFEIPESIRSIDSIDAEQRVSVAVGRARPRTGQ